MGGMKRTLYVIPLHRYRGISDFSETWRVIVEGKTADGRPVTRVHKANEFVVRAERDPDNMCAEVAIAGETSAESTVTANRRALALAKVLACGYAVECPGIVACSGGSPCPYGLK